MITLAELTSMAQGLLLLEQESAIKEQELKDLNERARALREESIPMAMLELNITSFKMDTGQTISCKQDVYAAIPAARRDEAFAWLEQHGFGALVKLQVFAQLGKGEQERAQECVAKLRELGLQPEVKQDVHAQTLKAWLREQLEQGAEVDLELFGARPVWVAKVK